jgi:hypothetical protein
MESKKLYDEYSQLFMWSIINQRIKEGAFDRFSFLKCQWFDNIDSDGHDRSINYYDRVCLN